MVGGEWATGRFDIGPALVTTVARSSIRVAIGGDRYPGSRFTSVADVMKTGANVINIHQGVATMINPYIN